MKIITPRLQIRPAKLSDASFLYELNLDPDVTRFTGDQAFLSLLDAQNLIKKRLIPQFENHKMGRFMVFDLQNQFLGWCGLRMYSPTQEVDLGYRFLKKFWNQGFATEASKAFLHYGIEKLGLQKIIAKALPQNHASQKVMIKIGMSFKATYRDPEEEQTHIVYQIDQYQYQNSQKSSQQVLVKYLY